MIIQSDYKELVLPQKDEALIYSGEITFLEEVGFKQPMVIKFPFPCWATRREEVKGEIADLW